MDQEDLSFIHATYYVPRDFELGLPSLDAWVNSPPLGWLGFMRSQGRA